mmetsp:Transcript_14935/g.38709  ORF Transcript_14935/g.38709 Transcript_14935/m.38709 type:complete len:218 (+) Transcript_14935:761-1414(+)
MEWDCSHPRAPPRLPTPRSSPALARRTPPCGPSGSRLRSAHAVAAMGRRLPRVPASPCGPHVRCPWSASQGRAVATGPRPRLRRPRGRSRRRSRPGRGPRSARKRRRSQGSRSAGNLPSLPRRMALPAAPGQLAPEPRAYPRGRHRPRSEAPAPAPASAAASAAALAAARAAAAAAEEVPRWQGARTTTPWAKRIRPRTPPRYERARRQTACGSVGR